MTEINCPLWWKSTLEDVEETLALVKRGNVSVLGRSAGGRPIYRVEYGKSNVKMGTANLSSALGAHDLRCFADKTGEDYVPTVFLDGAVHGGEFEGTMSLLNLIKELETGTDYNGDAHPELMDIVSRVHLVIIPVSTPTDVRESPSAPSSAEPSRIFATITRVPGRRTASFAVGPDARLSTQ